MTISQDAFATYNLIDKQGAGRVAGVITGTYNYVLQSGTGQIDTARGLWNTVVKTNSGDISSSQAVYCYQSFSGGGTVQASYGLYLDNAGVSGVTLTAQYGLYIAVLTTGATNYAIYSAGGQSYHAGNFGIGVTAPATPLHAVSTTATTDALRNVLTLGANVTSTGVGAAGLGGAILFQAESSTTVASDMAQIGALWTDATHATRTSKLTFATVNSAGSLNTDMTVSLGGVGIGTAPVAGTRIAASILANDASIANIYGSKNTVVANHSTGNLSFAYGTYNQAIQQGAGGVSNLAALVSSVAISDNAPNTANGIAERGLAMAYCDASSVTVFKASAWGQATGGKTVTLARGLWIAAPTTTGTITTANGIYLEAITGAGTNYAIYSAGGQSYHAGNFGIGNTAPAEALDVTGNINTTGVVKVDDVQVLSNRVMAARAANVANSGDATTDGLIDALRDAMIAHGLIAAA